jgi:hypothetical protein
VGWKGDVDVEVEREIVDEMRQNVGTEWRVREESKGRSC